MRRWSVELIEEIKKLRRKGLSYGQLSQRFGIAKSSLHYWIGEIHRPEKYREQDRARWIKEFQPLGALANKRLKDNFLEKVKVEAEEEVLLLSEDRRVLKTLLAMLYWAEGAKGRRSVLVFANTDPKLMLLFVSLLRRSYEIDEKKLRVRLHLHYYHRARKMKSYWSDLLKIPQNQFGKIYWKPRSKSKKFRQNFGGICFLGYNSVRLKDEIMAFALASAGRFSQTHP